MAAPHQIIRVARWLVVVGVVVVCFSKPLPLFHIIPLERARQEKAAVTFNPERFAEKFWDERLLKSLDRATPADTLLPLIKSNPADARKKFSRTVGLSESYTYFLSGKGRVLSVTDDEITLAVSAGATSPEISIQTGLLFGNAIRNGTGLLDVNAFPNSQDFNAISEALNHLVETRVLPNLKSRAKAGAIVRFTGCAEVNDESSDLAPLKIVPIEAIVE